MNKTVKKVLVFIVVLVVVYVGCITFYLLSQLPGGGSFSGGTISGTGSEPSVSPTVSDSKPTTTQATISWEKTGDKTKYTVTFPGVSCVFVSDMNAFSVGQSENGVAFVYDAAENTYLNLNFVAGTKAVDLAPGYLDSFISYNEFEQSGVNMVPGTQIPGETVAANDGKRAMQAWLVNVEDGVVAVAISYPNADGVAELSALTALLTTLMIDNVKEN